MKAGGPHAGETPIRVGASPEEAAAALILVHGRGARAEDIVGIAEAIDSRELSITAPQATGHTWYPQSFMAPVEANEPGRSSGLAVLEAIVGELTGSGISTDRIVLAGFSQGACLTLEYVARHPRRYGGVVGLTGGLIGPPGSLGGYRGSLEGTPILLSSGDPDPHVPWSRVEETAEILEGLGAEVELQRYPGRAHTISRDEQHGFERLVQKVLQDSRSGRLVRP